MDKEPCIDNLEGSNFGRHDSNIRALVDQRTADIFLNIIRQNQLNQLLKIHESFFLSFFCHTTSVRHLSMRHVMSSINEDCHQFMKNFMSFLINQSLFKNLKSINLSLNVYRPKMRSGCGISFNSKLSLGGMSSQLHGTRHTGNNLNSQILL